MKKATMIIALAIVCVTSVSAQDHMGMQKHSKEHACMMMSDSTAQGLGLTTAQIALVKESDARCMKACEKVGENKEGHMDHAAMATHDAEMKKILTADQYAKWNAMCNMSKAEMKEAKPEMKH
jgi:Spy/CpxP family protein refolding chaperone